MANTKTNQKPTATEEIYSQFMALRNEQRNLVNNLSTLELDLKEHKWVSPANKENVTSTEKIGFYF